MAGATEHDRTPELNAECSKVVVLVFERVGVIARFYFSLLAVSFTAMPGFYRAKY